jgi:hypothetical protein
MHTNAYIYEITKSKKKKKNTMYDARYMSDFTVVGTEVHLVVVSIRSTSGGGGPSKCFGRTFPN